MIIIYNMEKYGDKKMKEGIKLMIGVPTVLIIFYYALWIIFK